LHFTTGNAITISAFVRPNVITNSGTDHRTIVVKGRTSGTLNDANYAMRITGQNAVFYFRSSSVAQYVVYSSNTAPLPVSASNSAWYHIAATHIFGSGAVTKIYVNGVEQTGVYSIGAGATKDNAPVVSNEELWLGSIASGSAGSGSESEVFNGLIDEVAIFRTALTGAQIQNLSNINVPEPAGLVVIGAALPLLRRRRTNAFAARR
jgi:hypothetical protein